MIVPLWLKIVLGLIPMNANVRIGIQAAYAILSALPWFHKPVAHFQLNRAIKNAARFDHAAPLEDWAEKWKCKILKKC